MKSFHCVLQAARPTLPDVEEFVVENETMMGLRLPQLDTRFAKSFEEVATAFKALARMYFEPDGSFVWVVEEDQRYQLDGSLYDDGERLLNVDLKGTCNAKVLDEFLGCLGWPEQSILFQLVQQGFHLTESEFRKHFVR